MSESPEKKPVQHYENVSLSDVTKVLPCVDYAICTNSAERPYDHVGDWPEEGRIYPVRMMESKMDGIPVVHVLGFEGSKPYFNAFGPHRFSPLFTVWLN